MNRRHLKTTPEMSLCKECNEVLLEAGRALYLAQMFELSLELFLLRYTQLTKKQVTIADLEALGKKLRRKTIGGLLHEIVASGEMGEGSFSYVELALVYGLESRNRLAHHIFKEVFIEKLEPKQCKELLEEIKCLQDYLYTATHHTLIDIEVKSDKVWGKMEGLAVSSHNLLKRMLKEHKPELKKRREPVS